MKNLIKLLIVLLLLSTTNVAYVDEIDSTFSYNIITKPREFLKINYNYITSKYNDNTIVKKLIVNTTPKKLININIISKIESSNNRYALSYDKSCKGVCQLTEDAWNEASMSLYGKIKYSYYLYWSNPKINKQIADEYYNDVLPDYLKAYNIPISVNTLIASYNYGPGRVKSLIKKYGNNWTKHLPLETKSYIKKYCKK